MTTASRTQQFSAPKWHPPKRSVSWASKYVLPPYAQNLMDRPERYLVLYGGRGGGKSTAIAVTIVEYCRRFPGTRVVIVRDYKTSSEDTALQLTWDVIQATGVPAYKARTGMRIYFDNDSRISLLGSERNYGQLRGLERVSIAWVEEGQDVSEQAFETLVPSVRGPNAKIIVSFNPQDVEDYVSQQFIEDPRPDAYIFRVNYGDYECAYNPATEAEFQESLRRGNPNHAHIWNGAYRSAQGLIFDASRFQLTECHTAEALSLKLGLPLDQITRVRSWDFAATSGDGDFTVGLCMAKLGPATQPLFMIEDVIRGRWSPDMADAEALAATRSDGLDTIVRLVQDPGAAGIRDLRRLRRLLVPYTNKLVAEPVSGSKIKRAAGFASAVNNELVYVPQGTRWLRPLQYELRSFTGERADMDDQVDAGADAYELLAARVRERRGALVY